MPDTYGARAYDKWYTRLSAVDEVYRADEQVRDFQDRLYDLEEAIKAHPDAKRSNMTCAATHIRAALFWINEHLTEKAT